MRQEWRDNFIAWVRRSADLEDIENALVGWGLYGDDPYLMWESCRVFEEKSILPFEGGYLQQPKWWHDNLRTYQWILAWMRDSTPTREEAEQYAPNVETV